MKKQIFKIILSISLFVFSFILVNAEIEDYSYDEIPCQTYTGKNITPGLVIKKGEYVLQEGIDYTLSYKNNKKVGNATISVTGSEEYNDLILEVPFTISYKITYKLNGGTNNLLNPLFYDGKVAIKLKSPTRKGYTFNGWYSDKKFKKKVTTIKKGSKNNLTLYAKWTANKYNVKFNSNGGSGKLANLKNKVYDKSFKLPANKFKRKGYKFIGWNTKKDGTGTLYKNKASVKNLSAKNKATVTLYAQWQLIKYTIKYNLNGGVNDENNNEYYYINTPDQKLKKPSKSGYKFLGWYSDKKFKTKVTTIKEGSTGNKTLYAKWSIITYIIKYELNGGKNSKNPTDYKVTSETIVLKEPTKIGYIFDGWYSDDNFENKIEKIDKGSNINYTLYAKWNPIKYSILFDGNYNDNNDEIIENMNDCKYDEEYELPENTFTREPYKTYGWNTKPDGTGISLKSGEKIKNLTTEDGKEIVLYSEWRLNEIPTVYEAKKKSYLQNRIHIIQVGDANHFTVYRSMNPDNGFVSIGDVTTKPSFRYAYFYDNDIVSKTKYYYKVRSYIEVNGLRIYSDYTDVYSVVAAEKPKFTAKVKNTLGEYSYYGELQINNKGNLPFTAGGNSYVNFANVYPYDGASLSKGDLYTHPVGNKTNYVTLDKKSKTTFYYRMDQKRYFSNGAHIIFLFFYDSCLYIGAAYDDGTYTYQPYEV